MRRPRDFVPYRIDRVWIDTGATNRSERLAMIEGGISHGDVLVLLDRHDLGRAEILEGVERQLTGMGVSTEIAAAPASPAIGRPPKFAPDPDQDARISKLWHDTVLTGPYVLRRAGEIMGRAVARHHLTHRYGPREKRV